MMNFADLVLCLLTGFAIPLALSGFVAERAEIHAGRGQVGPASRFFVLLQRLADGKDHKISSNGRYTCSTTAVQMTG